MRIEKRNRDQYLLAASTFCKRGTELPQTKLTPELIEDIRSAARQREKLRQHIRDTLSNEALAAKHGVHVRTIEKALTRETWCHL